MSKDSEFGETIWLPEIGGVDEYATYAKYHPEDTKFQAWWLKVKKAREHL
jgi:hypothetical protein